MQFKLTVGDSLEVEYATTKEYALKVATRLAFKYKGETVVALDTMTGATAFTRLAPLNCPACED